MKGRRPRPLDDGGLVDRTGSLFIPSFEPPLVYARFKKVRKSFCSILGVFKAEMQVFMPHDTIILTGQKGLSGYQKNFKFSSKTPLECTFEVANPLPTSQTTLKLSPTTLRKEVSIVLPPTSRTRNPKKMRSPVVNSWRGQRENPGKLEKGAGESSRKSKTPTVPTPRNPVPSMPPKDPRQYSYSRGKLGLLLFFLTFTKMHFVHIK